jgi:phosphoglycolate phosphatase-like HAD superfamily hydrolase
MGLAAILDVDGTLVDTNYHHAIAWFRAFRDQGVTPPVWRIHRHMGMGGDQLVAAVAGDSTWDCRAAARAGIQTIAVLTGGFSEQELGEAGALAVFDSLPALSRHLDQTPLR